MIETLNILGLFYHPCSLAICPESVLLNLLLNMSGNGTKRTTTLALPYAMKMSIHILINALKYHHYNKYRTSP